MLCYNNIVVMCVTGKLTESNEAELEIYLLPEEKMRQMKGK